MPDTNEFHWDGETYRFRLSPEWTVEIDAEALKRSGVHPHGPLRPSHEARVCLLRAALYVEQTREANEIMKSAGLAVA